MRIFAISLLAAVAGCAATIPPVNVTRFHLGQPIAANGVVIAPMAGGDPASLEFRTYAAAVAKRLAGIGFPEAPASSAPLIAEVDFSRGIRTQTVGRSPFSIGIGGGTFGRHGGVSVGTNIGLGGSGTREHVVSRLSVRLKTARDGKAIWEGRAETEAAANAPAAQPGLAAEKLATALFQDFPGPSGTTITVP